MNDLEHLAIQLLARFGLKEPAKPLAKQLARSDVFMSEKEHEGCWTSLRDSPS